LDDLFFFKPQAEGAVVALACVLVQEEGLPVCEGDEAGGLFEEGSLADADPSLTGVGRGLERGG
jgi:hypothetical protein